MQKYPNRTEFCLENLRILLFWSGRFCNVKSRITSQRLLHLFSSVVVATFRVWRATTRTHLNILCIKFQWCWFVNIYDDVGFVGQPRWKEKWIPGRSYKPAVDWEICPYFGWIYSCWFLYLSIEFIPKWRFFSVQNHGEKQKQGSQ